MLMWVGGRECFQQILSVGPAGVVLAHTPSRAPPPHTPSHAHPHAHVMDPGGAFSKASTHRIKIVIVANNIPNIFTYNL